MLHRLTVAASDRHSPVCISQWLLSQSHSEKKQVDVIMKAKILYRCFLGLRPAHLSCGFSCVRLMCLAAVCVYIFGPDGLSCQRLTVLSRCFTDIMHTTVVEGVGTRILSQRLLWGNVVYTECYNKWSGKISSRDWENIWHVIWRTYSGSQRGCSSNTLGGSARSNDLQTPGGTDSCEWEDGRWDEEQLICIHTSDNPDSWRNLSNPPRLQE